jgi:hypothetical protein
MMISAADMVSNSCWCLRTCAWCLQEKLQSQLMLLRGMLRADAAVQAAAAGRAAGKGGSSKADTDAAAAGRLANG